MKANEKMDKTKKENAKHSIHKYYRGVFQPSGTIVYRCGIAGCPHFLFDPMVEGRISICWRCGVSFVVTKKSMKSKKMHCVNCTRGRYNKVIVKVKEESQFESEINRFFGNNFEESMKEEVKEERSENENKFESPK